MKNMAAGSFRKHEVLEYPLLDWWPTKDHSFLAKDGNQKCRMNEGEEGKKQRMGMMVSRGRTVKAKPSTLCIALVEYSLHFVYDAFSCRLFYYYFTEDFG